MRIKPLVVLSLVCSLSQAADTVASLGDSVKATQFVTAVDHTKLINGATQVIANTNGTASISTAQTFQKPDCVKVAVMDGNNKQITVSFRNTSAELSDWWRTWPSQIEFSITYDGVTYEATTIGETDSEDSREVSTSLSWFNGCRFVPGSIGSPSYYNGVFYDFKAPGGAYIIGDGNGETCWTYTYTGETGAIKTIATVDQLDGFVYESVTNGLASKSFVNTHKWDWSEVTNKPSIPDENHTHKSIVNGDWELLQMDDGKAVIKPAFYYGEDNGLGIKFVPSIPIEDLHDICSTNAAARIPSSMEIELDGSVSSAGYGYTMGSGNITTFYATNKVSYAEGVVFPDTVQISFDIPFTTGRIYIYNIPILCGRKKTLVTTDYIKSKVQNVNVNLQSAEDTRVALTNLITILKNL